MKQNRRLFIKKSVAVTGAIYLQPWLNNAQTISEYILAPMPYTFDALEPHIDAKTMELHYSKHHKGYVNQLNKAMANTQPLPTLESLLNNISKYTIAIRNNGGGHFNHSMFWQMMDAKGGGLPNGKLLALLTQHFGDFDAFKQAFKKAALSQFG
jgi:Fe-Mn family superoxide dismutase